MSVYSKERADYLALSLKSITVDQTLVPNEIVLVKDGPLTPELDSVCEDYANLYPTVFKIVTLPENVGLGRALNEGLKHCSYELVARMDSDDISKPNRFERQIEVFEANPDLDIVGAWIEEFDGNTSNVISTRRLPKQTSDLLQFAKSRNPLNHPTVMFRKSAVDAVGGYKHFALFEDYYLWARMLVNNAQIYNIQESLLFFRFSSEMIKRRGGIKYAITEMSFFKELHRIGLISVVGLIKNIMIRFASRVVPNSLRQKIYSKLLRK